MVKVSLRLYNRDIEGMIEAGQLDEAVAHCQHILRTFPMHVETYLLLGKAFLEGRKYTDAADIFQRTLMSVPDNFVSHVGMSIIRDDEGKLDDAIWHMERAFEVQPSNPAIQGELRRLYGRRDGVEPHKIRLSRDALANMYSQGELFNQAIAEIKAVLADDPNRPDLQVMLARAYFRVGQKVEAAEIAANLLKKYVYCLDALRILVDVLPGSARGENTQVYRQRLAMLDPYASFVTGSVFESDKVADNAVNLERLEYKKGETQASSQPGWASSLGIQLTDEKSVNSTPVWLGNNETPQIPAPTTDILPQVDAPSSAEKPVPDWMRNAGWQESSGESPAEKDNAVDESNGTDIAPADIPDWLRAMAPQGATDLSKGSAETTQEDTPPSSVDENLPNWLAGLGLATANASTEATLPEMAPGIAVPTSDQQESPVPANAEKIPETTKPGLTVEEDAFPDWLKGLDAEGQNHPGDDAILDGAPQGGPVENLVEIGPTVLLPASETPDSPIVEIPMVDTQPIPPPISQPVLDTSKTPTKPLVPKTAEIDYVPVQPKGEVKPLNIEDDALAWLESLAVKQGAKEEELLSKPEDWVAEMPASVRQTNEDVPDNPVLAPEPTKLELVDTELLKSGPIKNEEITPSAGVGEKVPPETVESDDTVAWLESLAAKQAPLEGETPIIPDDSLIGIPDWLKNPIQEPTAMNENPASIHPEQNSLPVNIDAETKAWLDNLDGTQNAEANRVMPLPLEGAEAIPEWLHEPIEELPIEDQTPAPNGEATTTGPQYNNLEAKAWTEDLSAGVAKSTEKEFDRITDKTFEIPDWFNESTTKEVPSGEPQVLASQEASLPPASEAETKAWFESLANKREAIGNDGDSLPGKNQVLEPDRQEPAEEDLGMAGGEQLQPKLVSASTDIPAIPLEDDASITSWLSKLDIEEALKKNQAAPESDKTTEASSEPLPDWLKDLDKPAQPIETTNADTDLPDWLRQTAEPTRQDVPSASNLDNPVQTEMPSWIDDGKPTPTPPAPTAPEEWIPVSDKPLQSDKPAQIVQPAPQVEPPTPVVAPISRPSSNQRSAVRASGTGMLSRIPGLDKDANLLVKAQSELDDNKLAEAMRSYTSLIKKGRLLDEVIHDLREALYRYPVDIIVWQTLGDASMRANRLQDALDANTKAEELLR